MTTGRLTINFDAIAANWRAMAALSASETGAVVKADGYGCGAGAVGQCLARAGARRFFVAASEEGVALRRALGPGPEIFVFSGAGAGDGPQLRGHDLIPLLNSAEQARDWLPGGGAFGVQIDSGMNRLGMEPEDFAALRNQLTGARLIMSHLACADEPDHPMNARQLATFRDATDGFAASRSLAATGGILLGRDFHFDLTRPGVGLYGGAPFSDARPVVSVELPVIQTRPVAPGESVGYGNAWTAARSSRVATVAAGYADGLLRGIGAGGVALYAGDTPCPLIGRVSMDLITVDVTDLGTVPDTLSILNAQQTVDDLARAAGTIGYEVLTSLGHRYARATAGAHAPDVAPAGTAT
ncbi:MAG: alanine racemase [Pseudomonadota bacterium]